MLFIDDNQAKFWKGGKESRAGANDQVNLSLGHPYPLIIPLTLAETAVEHGHPVPQTGSENPLHINDKGDFRHHEDGLTPQANCMFDGPLVDLRFPAAGYPMQKKRLKPIRLKSRLYLADDLILFGSQRFRFGEKGGTSTKGSR